MTVQQPVPHSEVEPGDAEPGVRKSPLSRSTRVADCRAVRLRRCVDLNQSRGAANGQAVFSGFTVRGKSLWTTL
jgi:hypothetical protein